MLFVGEIAALTGSALWGISSHLYGTVVRELSPTKMNLIKNVFAAACFGLVCFLFRISPSGLGWHEAGALLLSGVIGIGLGDTVWFLSLRFLPVHSVLVIGTLSPIISAVLAWLTIGELLSISSWLCMAITVAGIALVVSESQKRAADARFSSSMRLAGIGLVVLAVVLGAVSNVITRSVFVVAEVSPFWSGFLRLFAGSVVAFFSVAFMRVKRGAQPRVSLGLYGRLLGGASLGTVVGIFCQQTAFQHTSVGVAQALMSVTPVFSIVFAIATGKRPSRRSLFGSLIATVGVVGLVVGV
jgi:drug/metabolite transporter (DMT)-like permease